MKRILACTLLLGLVSTAWSAEPKPLFDSGLISPSTPGNSKPLSIDLSGQKELYLVVRDGGDGFGCDWANWATPKLSGPAGEKRLTDLKWKSATTGFGEVRINANANGAALRMSGQPVEFGIGTHANSLIVYDLPPGYTRFEARVGLDDGGLNQGCGSTVQFLVFGQKPPASILQASGGSEAVSREAANAVAALDVAEGLEATLFAAEPLLKNPSNIDIDHLGRVWVCEVMNYRRFANKDNPDRPEGDRILVLEDTDHDGVADKQTVFYQGTDVDSAHGICVLGDRVIISCGDSVFSLYDRDGDLKADKDSKELLFTGISGTQHDHGIHAFVFGPDGKLYFNFGNSGGQLKDKHGKPIIDKAGNEINSSRKPYQEGMVFRCNLDGSDVETLGWNFRNNWEVAVDSFGTMWQSDNDDDGNRGVRINFVMEFGNYGYKDELTGAGWREPRTNMEKEIPLQHWHLNDPGVVPNLLQTGAGSPTGLCVYEGDLLPKIFHGALIHCDAGPSVVRAYITQPDGAGYKAEMVNILQGARDNWFRPSDVCVAPDGSLIVADWYDPGVGGHRQGDVDRGRLFRVAPPGSKYTVPKVDFSTVDGAIAALKSPNQATRYLAWTALQKMGGKAFAALGKVYHSGANDRVRARAFWLRTKLTSQPRELIGEGLHDSSTDLRVTALRAHRELGATQLLAHQSEPPSVRRETLIQLRGRKEPEADQIWANMAAQYPVGDRWYLEALGIAADGLWDDRLASYLNVVSDGTTSDLDKLQKLKDIVAKFRANRKEKIAPSAWEKFQNETLEDLKPILKELSQTTTRKYPARQNILWAMRDRLPEVLLTAREGTNPAEEELNQHIATAEKILDDLSALSLAATTTQAGRDIIWRSRAKQTPALLAKIISDPATPVEELPRYFRAFDFLTGETKEAALTQLAFATPVQNDARTVLILTESLNRIPGFNAGQQPDKLAVLNSVLDQTRGTPAFLTLIERFQMTDRYADVVALVQDQPDSQFAVDAAKALLGRKDVLKAALNDADPRKSAAVVRALGNSAEGRAVAVLLPIVDDPAQPLVLRQEAAKGLAKSKQGVQQLLERARQNKLTEDIKPAVAFALQGSTFGEFRSEIGQYFPLPPSRNDQPLPPLDQLYRRKGDVTKGKVVFNTVGKCNTCHIVSNEGKDVGPNLTEIGSKLSREALFESILFPSAGISHNYETWTAVTNDGNAISGLKVSETPAEVQLKGPDAIVRTIKKSDLDELVKQSVSLMPADLQKTMTVDELLDVIEFVQTLKKP